MSPEKHAKILDTIDQVLARYETPEMLAKWQADHPTQTEGEPQCQPARTIPRKHQTTGKS